MGDAKGDVAGLSCALWAVHRQGREVLQMFIFLVASYKYVRSRVKSKE